MYVISINTKQNKKNPKNHKRANQSKDWYQADVSYTKLFFSTELSYST